MPTRIAICLLEDHITDLNTPNLMGGQPLSKIALDKADSDVSVYLKTSSNSTPEWADIVNGFASFKKGDVITASSGAIVFVKNKNRILACCFGTSVANINKENIVRDFGLAVAYNRIPKRNYKAIETYTLTENPITNNRSAAMPSTQTNFNLDSYLETITELSGKYYSSSRNVLIKGKEFFSTPAPLSLDEIKKLCATLVIEYDKTILNPEFKKLTAVSKVKSKKLIDFLDDKLCESLNKRASDIYLVDYQHYEDLNSYSLTPKGEKLTELELNDLFDSLVKGQKFTTAFLKTKKIGIFNSDSQQIDEWSLYRCLFTEFSLNIGGHILYKGNWYEIQKRYLQDLKDFISTYEIQASTVNLPVWDKKKKEGGYNIDAAAKVKGQCWDKALYTHRDFSYGIEFCDILLPGYVMHVKKLSSSSLNSHLLMQTYVSAQLLKSDPLMRKWIKTESKNSFKKNIFLKPSNDFKENNVKYLIVLMAQNTSKSLADSLPFFSLVTFNMMIRKITQLDFDVEICLV